MGVASPHLSDVSEETITRDILKLSGRMATDSDEGVEMADGQSAREYVAQMNREMFEEAAGESFDDPTMAELQDAILYSLFPNFQVWIGYGGNIVYRFLPNGNDPDSCIFDAHCCAIPKVASDPPRSLHRDSSRPAFCVPEALGSLGGVFDQDDANLPAVQKGMKNSATGKVISPAIREAGSGICIKRSQVHQLISESSQRSKFGLKKPRIGFFINRNANRIAQAVCCS